MGAIGGGIFSLVKGWRNSPAVRLVLEYFFKQLICASVISVIHVCSCPMCFYPGCFANTSV
jgi:hypothetical protein